MSVVLAIFATLSFPIFILGSMKIAYYPAALMFEGRRRQEAIFNTEEPLISVVVPAYNEGVVLANCVDSILADGYPNKEVILVDDGSTDDTRQIMERYALVPEVVLITKVNGGKASALNAGIARANGEVLFFVDADGVFAPQTIREMLAGFDRATVGAVCGNDEPVNLDRVLPRLAALMTHVGTGFCRRGLALIGCLPIVSGNLGAFRRHVVERAGGFREQCIGEDLELTWRVHRMGFQVNFRPSATVYAEVPATCGGLWKQRVRWARGFLQTVRIHRDMIGRSRYGPFGLFLTFNVGAMLVVPFLQLATMVMVPPLVAAGLSPIGSTPMLIIGWLGLFVGLVAVLFALVLDRAWRDLRFLYLVPLWPLYSLAMSAVMVWAVVLELRGTRAEWNKLHRTGVVSRPGMHAEAQQPVHVAPE
ncbi:glycosyltransferase family 2 protein [Cryptosporangium japonicum]|uniref:Glycosyltransferase family 2 protein n=1 Tax=Cryptosporangium japonicum TaxID=80872 RepID=A0ABP3D9Z9_9ACTN